jgi:hypothetical protein
LRISVLLTKVRLLPDDSEAARMTDVRRKPRDATAAPDSTTEHGSHSHAGH